MKESQASPSFSYKYAFFRKASSSDIISYPSATSQWPPWSGPIRDKRPSVFRMARCFSTARVLMSIRPARTSVVMVGFSEMMPALQLFFPQHGKMKTNRRGLGPSAVIVERRHRAGIIFFVASDRDTTRRRADGSASSRWPGRRFWRGRPRRSGRRAPGRSCRR